MPARASDTFRFITCLLTDFQSRTLYSFLPRDALQSKARYCDRMSSVCLSVRLSVCLSVTLVDCDHIGWNSSKIISPSVSMGCSLFATLTRRVCSKGNTPKFGHKVTHPLLIWASETFDRKIAAEWLQIAQRHNGEHIGNYHRSF